MPDDAIGDLRAWAARCRMMARIATSESAASGFLRLAMRFEALVALREHRQYQGLWGIGRGYGQPEAPI
jgi:hypothetical protein